MAQKKGLEGLCHKAASWANGGWLFVRRDEDIRLLVKAGHETTTTREIWEVEGLMKMSEKTELEEAACNYFIDAYNQRRGTAFKIKQHRDKPDFVVEDPVSGQVVGIEITHLYYDPEDAKMLLGRSNKKLHEPHGPMNDTDWIDTLSTRLQEKDLAGREYNFEHRMFLVVRVAPSPFDKSTLQMYEDDIVIPPSAFDEIWLLLYASSRQAWTDLRRLK